MYVYKYGIYGRKNYKTVLAVVAKKKDKNKNKSNFSKTKIKIKIFFLKSKNAPIL